MFNNVVATALPYRPNSKRLGLLKRLASKHTYTLNRNPNLTEFNCAERTEPKFWEEPNQTRTWTGRKNNHNSFRCNSAVRRQHSSIRVGLYIRYIIRESYPRFSGPVCAYTTSTPGDIWNEPLACDRFYEKISDGFIYSVSPMRD